MVDGKFVWRGRILFLTLELVPEFGKDVSNRVVITAANPLLAIRSSGSIRSLVSGWFNDQQFLLHWLISLQFSACWQLVADNSEDGISGERNGRGLSNTGSQLHPGNQLTIEAKGR